jgi:hypothetical protein
VDTPVDGSDLQFIGSQEIVYDDFLDRLLSTYCTEGLMALSVR